MPIQRVLNVNKAETLLLPTIALRQSTLMNLLLLLRPVLVLATLTMSAKLFLTARRNWTIQSVRNLWQMSTAEGELSLSLPHQLGRYRQSRAHSRPQLMHAPPTLTFLRRGLVRAQKRALQHRLPLLDNSLYLR